MTAPCELTILMPCLNEAETLAVCIRKARRFLAEQKISGEVLIADNGSSDGSQALSESLGARVVPVPRRGYGAAGTSVRQIELMQYRNPSGPGPSSNTWPRCAPQFEHMTSVPQIMAALAAK